MQDFALTNLAIKQLHTFTKLTRHSAIALYVSIILKITELLKLASTKMTIPGASSDSMKTFSHRNRGPSFVPHVGFYA